MPKHAAPKVETLSPDQNPAPETAPPGAELDAAAGSELMRQQDTAAQLAGAVNARSMSLAHGLGMLSAFEVIAQFTGFAKAKWLMEMKESGAYKGAQLPAPAGGMKVLRTFEDLCDVARVSKSKALEDIQNIKLFGLEFMEKAESAGIGYRDMRRLRALPEAEREMVLADEKAGKDPEILRELLEEYVEKSVKADKEIEGLKDDLAANKERLNKKNTELDEMHAALEKQRKLPENALAAQRAKARKQAAAALADACARAVGGMVDVASQAAAILASAREDGDSVNTDMAHRAVAEMCESISALLRDAGVDADVVQMMAGQMAAAENADAE